MSETREGLSSPPLLDDHDRPGPPPLMAEEHRRVSKGLTAFIALFSLAAFGGIVWYAYDQGLRTGIEETAPLIRAEQTPVRVKPKNPGGMKIPHQDKMIFDQLSEVDTSDPPVERLLPRPEEPTRIGKISTDKAKLDTATSKVSPPKRGTTTAITKPTAKTVPNSGNETKLSPGVPADPTQSQRVPPALTVEVPPKPPSSAQKLETGAVSNPTKQSANALPMSTKPTEGGEFRIQIGAFRSESVARDVWSRAKALHRKELESLSTPDLE